MCLKRLDKVSTEQTFGKVVTRVRLPSKSFTITKSSHAITHTTRNKTVEPSDFWYFNIITHRMNDRFFAGVINSMISNLDTMKFRL